MLETPVQSPRREPLNIQPAQRPEPQPELPEPQPEPEREPVEVRNI